MNDQIENIPKICLTIDRLVLSIGRFAAWGNALLMVVILLQVVLRYLFGLGMVALEELQWHLYSLGFMAGLSYVLVTDANIRLDILHAGFSRRTKEKVEIFGILFLLMPFIAVFFLHSLDFVADSFRVGERSDAPMGLPWRWAIKAAIPAGFGLLFMAAISRLLKAISRLWPGRKRPGNGAGHPAGDSPCS